MDRVAVDCVPDNEARKATTNFTHENANHITDQDNPQSKETKTMLLNDVFPSKYVKAADLQGREVHVVIADVQIEKMGDDRKLVVYFQNKEKGLVTNKTNANRIALMYGEDTDGWIGKEVILGTDFVDFQGKTVEAIRIKPPARRATAPSRPAPSFTARSITGGGTIVDSGPPADAIEEMIGRDPPPSEEVPF